MVLDVSRTLLGTELVLEFPEQRFRVLAEDVDQHVEAPAVRHPQDHFPHAVAPAGFDQLIDNGDQAESALQGEPLLTDVLLVQVHFQRFRRNQDLQYSSFALVGQLGREVKLLQAPLDPFLLFQGRNMLEFRADGAAVGHRQHAEDLSQRGMLDIPEAARFKDRVHVLVAQAVKLRTEFRNVGA